MFKMTLVGKITTRIKCIQQRAETYLTINISSAAQDILQVFWSPDQQDLTTCLYQPHVSSQHQLHGEVAFLSS
jgi:hypothetical protein